MCMKYFNKLFFLWLMVSLFLSCRNNKSDLDNFLAQIHEQFSPEEHSLLIKCNDVECIENFLISHPHNTAIAKLLNSIPKKLTDSLDALGVGNKRNVFLLVCYNYRENGKTISYKKIMERIQDFEKRKQLVSDQKALDRIVILTKIAKANFKRINVNDTIRLMFPVEFRNNGYNALYRIPFENEDLCTLTCKILKKEFVPKDVQSKFDNDRFILTMRILKLNPTLLHFGLKDIKEGDNFILDILEYGRDIPHARQTI